MKSHFILLSLFCFVLFPIDGTEPFNTSFLRLKSLLNDVITRNPDLAAVKSRVKAATEVIPRVQTLDDPIFTIRFLNNPFGSKKEFTKQRRYRLSQKIPFIGKLRLRGEIAQHVLKFVENQEITTHRDLILQAKQLYFWLYLNKIARHINKENRDIVSRLINSAMAIYKSGQTSQDDILKAQIDLQMLDNELLILISEKEKLLSLINALTNRPPYYPIGDVEEYITYPITFVYETLESIAMRKRSELLGLQARVEEEEARAALARRDYYPDFNFTFMLQNIPDKQTAWGIDISFNLPIWIEDKQKRQVQEAEANALANISELAGLRARIRGNIREILAKIDAAEERVKLYKTSLVPKVIQTLATNEASYFVGKKDFLTVLDTRRQLQDVQLDYERARIEREILLAELEWEIGIPLESVMGTKPIVRFDHDKRPQKKKRKTLATRIRKYNKQPQQAKTKNLQQRKSKKTRKSRSRRRYKTHCCFT